jgi:hypothetical protein
MENIRIRDKHPGSATLENHKDTKPFDALVFCRRLQAAPASPTVHSCAFNTVGVGTDPASPKILILSKKFYGQAFYYVIRI